MEILIPSDRNWKMSILFGMLSLGFYLVILLARKPMAGYAPHMFSYNVGFFLPVLFTSLIFGLIAIRSYFVIKRENRKKYKLIYKVLPFLILIPQGIRIGIVAVGLIGTNT